eukprot:635887-Rhodomonas_salina.3
MANSLVAAMLTCNVFVVGAEMISFFMGGSRTPLQIRSHAQKYFLRERQSSAAGAGQKANLK